MADQTSLPDPTDAVDDEPEVLGFGMDGISRLVAVTQMKANSASAPSKPSPTVLPPVRSLVDDSLRFNIS